MYESISTLERLADEHRSLIEVVRDIDRLDGPCESGVVHELEQIVDALLAHLGCTLGATEELVYSLLSRELGRADADEIERDHREIHRCVTHLQQGRIDLREDAIDHVAEVRRELHATASAVRLHLDREELVYLHLLEERLRPISRAPGGAR